MNKITMLPEIMAGAIRPEPPLDMTPQQRALWTEIVESMPAGWFGPASQIVLRQFCRVSVNCHLLGLRLDEVPPGFYASDANAKIKDLKRQHHAETQLLDKLANTLRLTPRTRYSSRDTDHALSGTAAHQPFRPWQVK